jgi:hypothetical protein
MGALEYDLDEGLRQEHMKRDATMEVFLVAIRDEYLSARRRFSAMASAHEGYAIILEELDEAWDEIKANNNYAARREMIQVAAMALSFLMEVEAQ